MTIVVALLSSKQGITPEYIYCAFLHEYGETRLADRMPTSSTNPNRNIAKYNAYNTPVYLGMQLDGVLSTSQAANSFMGTGFDALVIFSDLFFSVILDQHRTTKHKVFHSTTLLSEATCIVIQALTTARDSFPKSQYEHEAEFDANTTILSIFS